MGGGNGAKSANARARNQAAADAAAKGSQNKANAAAMTIKCKVCMQPFLCNASEKVLKEHHESKHAKLEFPSSTFPHLAPSS